MKLLSLAMAALVLLAGSPLDGRAAEQSVQSLQKKCDAKDWSACHTLAYRYSEGEGVTKDEAKAAALNELACNAAYGPACTTLAFIVDDGGRGADTAKILRLVTRACELKDPGGCYFLGRLYNEGDGVPKDVGRATKLLEQACNGNEGDACMDLYLIYVDGKGVPKDAARANAFYEKGCDLESLICIMGFNLTLDPLVESCDAGNAKSCYQVGTYHRTGESYLKPDEATAAPYLEKGCNGGIAEACAHLAFLFDRGKHTKNDPGKAAALYQKGCTGGYAWSCQQLGVLHVLGRGVPEDPSRAAVLLQTACEANTSEIAFACSLLAKAYEGGTGVKKDPARAAVLHAQACRLGDKESCAAAAAANPSGPRAKPVVATTPAATPAALPASLKDAIVGCPVGGIHIGNATAADVQFYITGRGGKASHGSNNGKPTLNAMSGDFSDVGSAVMSVNYTFDAAGASAKLIGVTVVNHANSNDEYAKLLATRKAATEATAKNPKCVVRIVPNADTWFIHEFYELKK